MQFHLNQKVFNESVLCECDIMNFMNEYYKNLPKKRMAGGAIIKNKQGNILILETTYKTHWELPGGVTEDNESPRQSAEREIKEELGIDIKLGHCLVAHYRAAMGDQNENIMWVFDGGVVDESVIKLCDKELKGFAFVTWEEAEEKVGKRIASRLPYCKQALDEKRTIYLESLNLDTLPIEQKPLM
jgi:8-oxo-dGTP pyrophosphatase MutT (NUDIX family)